jgi:hypothetical protein
LRKKERRPAGRLLSNFSSGLGGLNVLRLPAFGAFYDIELNLLAFLQATESVRLDCGEVNEHILAILAADKTITLGIVKPLYCSCFHGVAYVPLVLKYALNFAGKCRQVTL